MRVNKQSQILLLSLLLLGVGCGDQSPAIGKPPLLKAICSVIGCGGEMWTRGQPPSVDTMVERASGKLTSTREENTADRQSVAKISGKLQQDLLRALGKVQSSDNAADIALELTTVKKAFISLEGKLSVGSRAGFGELAGQLRRFSSLAEDGQEVSYPAFALFTARTFSSLANELSVPAPTF